MKETAAVITVSDKASRAQRTDTSGPALCALLKQDGWTVVYTAVVPDEAGEIRRALTYCADTLGAALVLTTGGTGFSPRDVTPEATRAILERETPGIPEAMRAESLRITPYGCLSRSAAGIRGRTLIVNLPGSEKAAAENLAAVRQALRHGVKMLQSEGSAECAAPGKSACAPSVDQWLREAGRDESAGKCGMYLTHRGVVRSTARAQVRGGQTDAPRVTAMLFSYDAARVDAAVDAARRMPGIGFVRVWLNEGRLEVGDDIMLVLVGGDIRPHVIDALQTLVEEIKTHCVSERELP